MPTVLFPLDAWRIMLISRASNKFSGRICPGKSTKPVTGRIGTSLHCSSNELLHLAKVLLSKNTLSHDSVSTFCYHKNNTLITADLNRTHKI